MLPLLVVDAFTAEPFGGNPAAVCFLDALGAESVVAVLRGELDA